MELDSKAIGSGQLFLGSRLVPFGNYERLRFRVLQRSLRRVDGSYKELSSDPATVEMSLSSPLVLRKGDSSSLFLTWDLNASLEGNDQIRPALTVDAPLRQLPTDLVYVACPDIDTIFVVRSDRDWVADSFGLKGYPTYLALDPESSGQRLYVLAAREAAIKVVDLSSQRVVDAFHIPLNETPTFMTISPDGTSAYVLDEKNSYLSRLNLVTGQLMGRVHVPYRPKFAVYLADRDLLAVSLGLSQKVTLRDPLTLAEVGSIQTGSSPAGLIGSDGRLVVAESGANTVSVYDFNTRQFQSRLTVGFTPLRLFDSGSRIYVGNYDDGSLSVLFSGQGGVGREIIGLGQPLEMAYNQTYHRLYVGDEQEAGLAIIDTTTDQLRTYLRLGTRPLGMATLQ
jgi:DNA-binding beta-propeller fold protein YncE